MTDIKVIKTTQIAGSKYLSFWKRDGVRNGKGHAYFMACRGKEQPPPHSEKKPDAVVIVAFWKREAHQTRLVLTSEYRIPIGCRELGFPAGLIEESDYAGGTDFGVAAINAAVREMKEETGFDFTPVEVSPNNLYSSPGMTNESVVFVLGLVSESKNAPRTDTLEDIKTLTVNQPELAQLLDTPESERDFAFGKTSWPFMWAFRHAGFQPFIPSGEEK